MSSAPDMIYTFTIHSSPVTYGGSPPTYTTLSSPHAPSQSPVGGNPHMMHHPQTGARPQQQMQPMIPPGSAPPGRSPTNSGSPANAETGSEDSDDSVPVSQMQPGVVIKRPSPEPAIITQVANVAVAPVKKPKPQKKKKKRDPNEPQK
ncbi:hypothetical protein Ocin01_02778 [Orchesella cincta]|uniref:Uncharacterized protein n=1 Tax=Orchesella cincta TaxID=48709 RepID=A0A1D2NF59_ORCCI|nr:hypothetical protein Ocin01_02778 [Orchesella cincta]